MKLVWTEGAWRQYTGWDEKKIVKRINTLIEDIQRNGYEGVGNPEMLRGDLAGWASRRITEEHRLVYRIRNNQIEILQCRYHYRRQ